MSMRAAFSDVVLGMKDHEFWMTYGLNDVRAKYRRSKLGQWWITLTVALFILVIGGLYRGIFDADGGTYLAYLAVGYIAWLLMSDTVSSGCMILAQSRMLMIQRKRPFSTYMYRLVYREVLYFMHHVVLLVPIFMWLDLWPGFGAIGLSLLGLAMIVFTSFWVVMILSILTLRFRDIPPLTQSIMRMAFFATPVIWIDRNLGEFGQWVLLLNPFGYYLAIVRDPLLNGSVDPVDWITAAGLTATLVAFALATLSLTHKKITYWL